MSPRQFLQVGGVILVILGIVGFLSPSLFGLFNFTFWENTGHAALGIVAIILAPLPMGELQKWIVVLVGLVGLFFGVYGFVVSGVPAPNFYGVAQLDNPADNILHLAVGAWALAAAFLGKDAPTVMRA